MARFLLIHGSCHGAWCWRDVLPLLRAAGHEARAIDLPSHGDDTTPVNAVTLDLYARAIVDAIDDPVVLVGHSMAGYPITAAAELAPEKIDRLVYLCAYVPAPGMSLVDRRKDAPRQPLMDAVIVSEDRQSFTVDPAKSGEKFYQDCPPGTVAFANARLCPQAIKPQATVLDITERSRALPRHYIRCENDGTIPYEYQVTMTEGWPKGTVTDMPTGHSPFFAAPQDLARRLIAIAEAPGGTG